MERFKIAILAALAVLLAASPVMSDDMSDDMADHEAVRAQGAAQLQPFKRDLQQALREGLAKGPVEAVAACQTLAPEIARARSQGGVRVGRSSHRLRNPANVAPEWVRPSLEALVSDPSESAPVVVALSEDQWGYVEPIFMQPVCATCHGKTLAPALASRIEALYPEDRAVGFEVGELRGVFWVELPRSAP